MSGIGSKAGQLAAADAAGDPKGAVLLAAAQMMVAAKQTPRRKKGIFGLSGDGSDGSDSDGADESAMRGANGTLAAARLSESMSPVEFNREMRQRLRLAIDAPQIDPALVLQYIRDEIPV